MMENIPERPLEPEENNLIDCPVCGECPDMLYRNRLGEIVGCDECIRVIRSWDIEAEEEE